MDGIKRAYLPLARKHVLQGSQWGHTAGTDFWLVPSSGVDLAGTATAGTLVDELVDGGWTATSILGGANALPSAADFGGGLFTKVASAGQFGPGAFAGSYGDVGTPNNLATNAASDLLSSPAIFGDAAHMEMAAIIAGMSQLPRYLIAEFWGAFTTPAAEPISAMGFYEDAGAATTEANQYACISQSATLFQLRGNGSLLTTGLTTADAAWHKFRIVLEHQGSTAPNIYWYQDGVLQSATPAVGVQDEFPLRFGMAVGSGESNFVRMGIAHIFYDW